MGPAGGVGPLEVLDTTSPDPGECGMVDVRIVRNKQFEHTAIDVQFELNITSWNLARAQIENH